jgi:phenylacetate-CoA ligase
MIKDKSSYWNPILETLTQEKLQALQLKKFKRLVEWAYTHSPFYRRLYQEAGLEPEDIKTFEDIRYSKGTQDRKGNDERGPAV